MICKVIVITLILGTLLQCDSKKIPSRPLSSNERQSFSDLARATYDSQRHEKVTRALQTAAGVYTDITKSKVLELESTVIVVTLFSDTPSKDTLFNFLCFMQKYELKVLLYHTTEHVTFSYNISHVTTLRFPIHEIWSTYSNKKMKYSNRDQWVQYQKELVIQNHGTGLKFFPLLEVIHHNHNVIFFDLDMGFLFDPIPHLWQGYADTPDVITSLEAIRCKPESNNPPGADTLLLSEANGRARYMPNSGTMMIRSTVAGKAFLTNWLNVTVEGNWFNEQYAFEWPNGFLLSPSESCNKLPNGLISGSRELYVPTSDKKLSHNSIRYCFLNKYLFQTGMILFGCRHQSYYGNLSDAGIAQRLIDPINHIEKEYYFPMAVHVNARTPKSFKTKKNSLLRAMNLWILQDSLPSGKRVAEVAGVLMEKSKLKCLSVDVSTSRWVTKKFSPVWHTPGYFPEDLT